MSEGMKEVVLYSEQEKELGQEVTTIERRANAIVISDDASYQLAANFTRDVKAAQKKVDVYWEPMRKTTYDAYKAVTDHKKKMLDPLKNAEQILKRKMGQYQMEKERKRRAEEERLRKMALEEMERKLKEAADAESKGDQFGSEFAMAEAEVMDDMSQTISIAREEAKVKGVATTKTWEITKIDLDKLPCELAGVLLRPADTKAIMQLIKATKGTIKIPGVEYEESVSISVRAS